MIKKILCVFCMIFLSMQATYHQGNSLNSMKEYRLPIEIEHREIKELLMRVPEEQREAFVEVLKAFGEKRGFDWRFTLLLMYNESRLNTQARGGSYVGLIMFGKEVRAIFKLSVQDILNMNHVQQAELAVKVWERNESMGEKYHIKDFITLQLATFMPAWIPHHGNPYPASALVKKSNYPFVGKNGHISKESLLNFYRNHAASHKELNYFIGKF